MDRFAILALVLLGCPETPGDDKLTDVDGDGLLAGDDCDDGDADVGAPTAWSVDADGDGYGSDTPVSACVRPDGAVDAAGDCDDADNTVHPGGSELCDGVDNDCNGAVDDGVGTVWYADADGDGFGDATLGTVACEQPAGSVPNDQDCDDTRAAVFPDADEACNGVDDDCDGVVDDGTPDDTAWYADIDGDGHGNPDDVVISCHAVAGRLADASDCDDLDPGVNPAADERCDGQDNDCDGEVDEAGALDVLTWYLDQDGDGYGDDGAPTLACDAPADHVALGGDCDDADARYNPGAAETDCTDPEDYNCDGSTGYADADADGWAACAECDDADASNFPGAVERCDGVDNDCDSAVDEPDAVDAITWYADTDADRYGDGATGTLACTAPAGHVADGTDCDDVDPAVNPGATERCNGVDDDCDGAVDEDSPADALDWYLDDDGDGYGDPAVTVHACDAPADHVADATDCDDARRLTHPGATEYCNTTDDDCDGVVDDAAVDARTWWADADGDTYGDASVSQDACSSPAGYVRDDDDCDDLDAAVHPGATETCNSTDDDCDGSVDEGITTTAWYDDDDGDGYGGAVGSGCSAPAGSVANDWDCDDTDASVYPGADASCPWDSCLELLTDGIASTTGDYWIDFAGTATYTTCDMDYDGGGWTLIFDDDMSSPDTRWSTTSTYSCGSWGTILGGYGIIAGGEIDIDLSTYAIAHSETWVEMTYVALDSWDGETMYATVDGGALWSDTRNNHSTAYLEMCGWNRGYYGSYDSTDPVSATASHSAGTLNLAVGSTLDQAATDESFGFDDVYVWIR